MFVSDASASGIVAAAKKISRQPEDVLLVLVSQQAGSNLPDLVARLSREKIPFMGGIFPGVISGSKKYTSGAVLIALPMVHPPLLIQGLDRPTVTVPEPQAASPRAPATAIVLTDGFAPSISAFLSELFGIYGNSVHYFGGGAGFADLVQRPCVFCADGVFQNAAVVGLSPVRSVLGVRHGWERLHGPVVATKASGNIVSELNWQNAFEAYRTIVEPDCGRELTRDNFPVLAQAYPFGILREGAEDVVRDPIRVTEKGDLVCVGEVPENAVLNVLKGTSEGLIEAAARAVADCALAKGSRPRQGVIADCISRSLFLGPIFQRELDEVNRKMKTVDPSLSPEGMLSLGEISSSGRGFLEFFNKTVVAGVLHDG